MSELPLHRAIPDVLMSFKQGYISRADVEAFFGEHSLLDDYKEKIDWIEKRRKETLSNE